MEGGPAGVTPQAPALGGSIVPPFDSQAAPGAMPPPSNPMPPPNAFVPDSAAMQPPPSQEKKGTPWGRIAALAGGGIGLGLLGSKLSGGDISFGEALGMLGKGVADERFENMMQKRKQAQGQHETALEMVHQKMQSLQDIDIGKYPRLQALAEKYRKALLSDSEDGSLLSPKEATEILGMWTAAQGEMQQAKQDKSNTEFEANANRQYDFQLGKEAEMFQDSPDAGPPIPDDILRSRALSARRARLTADDPIPVQDPRAQAILGPTATPKMIEQVMQSIMNNEAAMARVGATIQGQQGMLDRQLQGEAGREDRALLDSLTRPRGPMGRPLMDPLAAMQLIQQMKSMRMTAPPGGRPLEATGDLRSQVGKPPKFTVLRKSE